jgi:hypothetical protein
MDCGQATGAGDLVYYRFFETTPFAACHFSMEVSE